MQVANNAGSCCGWTGNSPCTEADVTILQASRRDLTVTFTINTPTTTSSTEASSTLNEYFATDAFLEDISDENFTVTTSQVVSSGVTFVSVAPAASNSSQAGLGGTACEYVNQNLTAAVPRSGAFCVGATCTTLVSGDSFSSNGVWCAGCSVEAAGYSSDTEADFYVYPWSDQTVSAGTLYGSSLSTSADDFSLPNGGFVCPVDGSTCFALEAEVGLVPVTGVLFAAFPSDPSNPYSNGDLSSIVCPAVEGETYGTLHMPCCCCCI